MASRGNPSDLWAPGPTGPIDAAERPSSRRMGMVQMKGFTLPVPIDGRPGGSIQSGGSVSNRTLNASKFGQKEASDCDPAPQKGTWKPPMWREKVSFPCLSVGVLTNRPLLLTPKKHIVYA